MDSRIKRFRLNLASGLEHAALPGPVTCSESRNYAFVGSKVQFCKIID
jgi:hypothetical protein